MRGLLLRVLLNRSHGTLSKELLKRLPADDAQAVESYSVSANDPLPLLQQSERTMPRIHYSWIFSYLSPLEPSQRDPLIACLNESQRHGICRLFKCPVIPALTSPLVRRFYLPHLYQRLSISSHLPLEYLPPSPFLPLLELKKSKLIELIDLLGLYDLAHEMRRIVSTKNLKTLYTHLTARQQLFLRACLHQKDKVVTPPLHLEKLGEDALKLADLLHRRGLMRLSIALSGQHPDLIWYLTHFLDTGRGRLLIGRIRSEEIPTLSSLVGLQIDSARNFLLKGVL